MQYFNSLPKIIHTDPYGIKSIRTNIMARVNIIPEELKNPLIYYKYDVQDGDTPEIVAHKYYNDMYRYWIVLFANQMFDPYWDWPMSDRQFNDYLFDKYTNVDIYGTVHHYEKVITSYDTNTQTTTTNTVQIPQTAYISSTPSTNTYTLPTGDVTVNIQYNQVSIHDYESRLNESKRSINILNNQYVNTFEQQFIKLMSK
jgi:hypothetical protein